MLRQRIWAPTPERVSKGVPVVTRHHKRSGEAALSSGFGSFQFGGVDEVTARPCEVSSVGSQGGDPGTWTFTSFFPPPSP